MAVIVFVSNISLEKFKKEIKLLFVKNMSHIRFLVFMKVLC
jgi:hypothetical protein